MKKPFIKSLFIFILLVVQKSYSQDISFTASYPIALGNSFTNNSDQQVLKGKFDIGINYTILKINNIGLGISMNLSNMVNNELVESTSLVTFRPKVFSSYAYRIKNIALVPKIGVGYSWYNFIIQDIYLIDPDSKPFNIIKYSGFSIYGDLKAMLYRSRKFLWHVKLNYEYSYLTKYNISKYSLPISHIHLIYPGIGVTWLLE